jgi:hypothetical protein
MDLRFLSGVHGVQFRLKLKGADFSGPPASRRRRRRAVKVRSVVEGIKRFFSSSVTVGKNKLERLDLTRPSSERDFLTLQTNRCKIS